MNGDTSQDMRYAPPRAHVEDVGAPQAGLVLASRMQRLGAMVIDLVIILAGMWMVSLATPWNPWQGATAGLWTPDLVNPLIGFVLFTVIQGVLLARRGQTVGKSLLGIRILRSNGEGASLLRLLLVRYGIGYATTIVLPIGQVYGIVDALMIFRSSRRCLHDVIADTIVVKA